MDAVSLVLFSIPLSLVAFVIGGVRGFKAGRNSGQNTGFNVAVQAIAHSLEVEPENLMDAVMEAHKKEGVLS